MTTPPGRVRARGRAVRAPLGPVPLGPVPLGSAPLRVWLGALLAFGLMVLAGIRLGGFWPADAVLIGLGALLVLVVSVTANPLDRADTVVVASLLLLAGWWTLRAVGTHSIGHALPLGASLVCAATAFAAARPLSGRARSTGALAVGSLGAAGALVGFAGLAWRWAPEALPAQGLWRLSTTVTYADAAGLVLGVCLLVALGSDRSPALARAVVCLCAAGLVATQSRGALVAVLAGATLVPAACFRRFAVPLGAGVLLGAAGVASSPWSGRVLWLAPAAVVAAGTSAAVRWEPGRRAARGGRAAPPRRAALVATGVLGALAVLGVLAVLVRHELALRALPPSDLDRWVEWTAAWHQWLSAPVLGVGPDRLLVFHAADGTVAKFAHNEYLQVLADAGAVGAALLVLAVVVAARVVHRSDVVSSCAAASVVCWSVGGLFDFDWHLPLVGLLGGWCLALARSDPALDERDLVRGDPDRARRPGGRWRAARREDESGRKRRREEGGVTIPPGSRVTPPPASIVDSPGQGE